MEPVATPLPLPTLLSQVLVAHTIELDNEAELQLPHRTIRGDDPEARHDGPWLVSYALWANALQYVDAGGITVVALCGRARTTGLLLGGLRRWGYVTVTPPAGAVPMNPPQETACRHHEERPAGPRDLAPPAGSARGDMASPLRQRGRRPTAGHAPGGVRAPAL
jgi:hypothetical protein